MNKRVKVALVGFGHLGKWHAQKVMTLECCELLFIVDNDSDARKKATETYPEISVVSNVEKVLGKIDAVILASPTSTHYQLTKFLLNNNVHVFCEKPLAENAKQAEELCELSRDLGKVLQVGHSERFHKIFEKRNEFKDFFQNEDTSITMNRLGSFKGRATDVDVVQDLMIHDLDLLLFLFDERPIRIDAHGFKIRTNKWDHVTAHFGFKSNRKASITVSRNYIKEKRCLDIINSNGTLHIDLFLNKLILARGDENDSEKYVQDLQYEKRDHLLIEQKCFYESILNGTEPVVTANAGKDVVQLLDMVTKSLEINAPITI